MLLRIDPRIPRVWRTPTQLQFGIDEPVVTLVDVTNAEERIVAALDRGLTEPGFALIAQLAGASSGQRQALLERLRPVLWQRAPAAGPRPLVAVDGAGPTAGRVAHLLEEGGCDVTSDIRDIDAAHAALIVSHFAIVPERHGRWLRRDVPHLPIVFGDRAVTVGPLVEPGDGPCMGCVDRARRDVEPCWPAVATQLSGRTSGVETGIVSMAVASIGARMLTTRLHRGSRRFAAAAIRYDAGSGATRVLERSPHPECGCRALQGIAMGPAPNCDGGHSATS